MMKKILLGISGGIAAYKSCELVRSLVKNKYSVHVVMTKNAVKFIAPLTFKTLSSNPVFIEMFAENNDNVMPHISLSDMSDILVIVPATANIIGKIANGIADDLLSTLCLSFSGRILIAPAMNSNMYMNSIFQLNLSKLKEDKKKYVILGPEEGDLACGIKGMGRMISPDKILKAIENEVK